MVEIELFSQQFFVGLVSIIILDLVLAGDNAVVIAMAANRITKIGRASCRERV